MQNPSQNYRSMHAIKAVIIRDTRIALRSGGAWLMGLMFFAVFLSLAAIALGGNFDTLRPLGPALVWLSLVFSLLFSFEHLFKEDALDGNLEKIKLSHLSLLGYVLAKVCAHWLLSVLPLLLALPLAGLLFDLPSTTVIGLFFSMLIASPALVCYGAFSGACLVSFKGGGFLLVLLTIPLVIPVLIFAIGGALAYSSHGLFTLEFRALTGISIIASAIAIPAAAAALNVIME